MVRCILAPAKASPLEVWPMKRKPWVQEDKGLCAFKEEEKDEIGAPQKGKHRLHFRWGNLANYETMLVSIST